MRELLAKYEEVEVLIRIGEFKRGMDPLADQAVDQRAAIDSFLQQGRHASTGFDEAVAALSAVAP